MQLRALSSSRHSLAVGQRAKVSLNSSLGARTLLCHSTSTKAGTEQAGRSLEAVLLDVGIEESVMCSVKQRAPELSCISVQERVEPLLQCLQSLQLQPEDLRVMLLRCPRLLSFSTQRHVLPVVAFLREELGFDDAQVASTLRRFPGIMGYGVKSHLIPHCHYLKSLGVSEEELPRLILSRPQVLGTSIELVITYLRKWLRIERTHVGQLLWSYPLDYSLPRLVLPIDSTAVESSMEEPDPQEGGNSNSTAAGGSSSSSDAAAPSTAQASGSSGGSGSAGGGNTGVGQGPEQQQEQQQQPKQPRQVPLWGSPEACTWMDIDLRKGGNGGGSGSGGSGGGNGSGGQPGSDSGSNKQPPPSAA